MKKIISLLALATLFGGAHATSQTTSAGSFQYTYDDSLMQYISGSAYTDKYLLTKTVWDDATNQSYAANFRVIYGHIEFSNSTSLVATNAMPSVIGSYAANIDIASLNGLKISSSTFYGQQEGFMELGNGNVSSSVSGAGFTGQAGTNNDSWSESYRNETVNIPTVGRAGSFYNSATIDIYCSVQGCTVADYVNGLGTSQLNFSGVQTVTATASALGDVAAYQRSGTNYLFTSSYEFLGYANTAPVPEPETYAMLLAGLGVMGVMARRRKKST